MIVSTRGRYALLVMIDLAERGGDGYTPLQEIADRQGISEKYLESIIKLLTGGKLLAALRGKGGGYKLTKLPEAYSIGEILRLTEGSLAPVSCIGGESCAREGTCRTCAMWEKLDRMVNGYFDSITLADLVNGFEG